VTIRYGGHFALLMVRTEVARFTLAAHRSEFQNSRLDGPAQCVGALARSAKTAKLGANGVPLRAMQDQQSGAIDTGWETRCKKRSDPISTLPAAWAISSAAKL
jgi:hypothetical protein